jgi:hypothetical protein
MAPTLGDLLRDPRNRDERLPAIILIQRRGSVHWPLPSLERSLSAGDKLLLCGRPGARGWMQWTLNNPDVLTYVVAGTRVARGALWRWLEARRQASRNA